MYELLLRDFLHLVDGDSTIHVHGGLIGLMAEEVLNPLGAEALGFEKAGDGVAEDVRVEVRSAGIGIGNAGLLPYSLNDVVDQAQRYGLAAASVAAEKRAYCARADQVLEVTQKFVVDDRDNPGLATLPCSNRYPFALEVDIADV